MASLEDRVTTLEAEVGTLTTEVNSLASQVQVRSKFIGKSNSYKLMRGGAARNARRSHNPKIVGSNPTSATILC
jgi:hypothetical protein